MDMNKCLYAYLNISDIPVDKTCIPWTMEINQLHCIFVLKGWTLRNLTESGQVELRLPKLNVNQYIFIPFRMWCNLHKHLFSVNLTVTFGFVSC